MKYCKYTPFIDIIYNNYISIGVVFMGLFSKKKCEKINLKHIEGKGFDLVKEVSFDDEYLIIKQKFNNNAPVVKLKLDKITDVLETTKTEIKTKSKSVLGRAMMGGILLGPAGALVGGISGTKDKVEEEIEFLLIINYLDLNSDKKVIVFEELPGRFNMSKFAKALKSKCNIKNENKEEIYL